jgi:hypothetical protein
MITSSPFSTTPSGICCREMPLAEGEFCWGERCSESWPEYPGWPGSGGSDGPMSDALSSTSRRYLMRTWSPDLSAPADGAGSVSHNGR